MHYSVGALIRGDATYLLIDRAILPYGFACPAGHIDEGENAEEALAREVKEEVDLMTHDARLLFEEELDWNWCNKGVRNHYWYVFVCEVTGEVKSNNQEAKSAKWYTVEEIKKLALEPVWEYWFKKLKVL